MKKKILFIGALNKDNIPICGETIKNQNIFESLQKKYDNIDFIDTLKWKKNPIILFKIFKSLFSKKYSDTILSTSSFTAYIYIKFNYFLKPKTNLYYFVIGGVMADLVKSGRFKAKYYKKIKTIIVEGNKMKNTLNKLGIASVIQLPNFKTFNFQPKIKKFTKVIKFVFLSRINESKGVNLIFQAVKNLNKKGYKEKYLVDFYGNIESEYKTEFETQINDFKNTKYNGFINLRENSSYIELENYEIMLFPTYWTGEGFPGVIIDAFIAGLPIIASEWNMNTELVQNNITGIIIPIKDSEVLANKMMKVIDGEYDLQKMRTNCLLKAKKFHTDAVLDNKFYKTIGL